MKQAPFSHSRNKVKLLRARGKITSNSIGSSTVPSDIKSSTGLNLMQTEIYIVPDFCHPSVPLRSKFSAHTAALQKTNAVSYHAGTVNEIFARNESFVRLNSFYCFVLSNNALHATVLDILCSYDHEKTNIIFDLKLGRFRGCSRVHLLP